MPEASSNTIQFIDPADVDVKHAAFTDDERTVLDSINQRIAAGESLADIMDFLFDSGRSLFPCDRIGLAFVEEGGERVVAHWSRALYEPVLLGKGYAEDLRGSSLATIRQTGRLRIINDLEEYLRMKPVSESTALLVQEGVRSSMTCPLIVDGRNVGFLFRSSRKPNTYTSEEVLRHQAVAERLSQAVEKAYRLEQLEEANKAYTEMLGFVSHELKSPLASIVTDARLLTEGYLGEIDPKQTKKIEAMVRKANFLLNLVREYLDLARIEGGQLELNAKQVDFLADVLEPCLDLVQAAVQEKEVTVEQDLPEGPMAVECDPALLQVVLVNLLGNAVKYGNVSGKVRVTVSTDQSGFRVSVWNEGPGFPESQRSRLFRRFSRIQSPELMQRKGTGVGLYTTWRIVQLHGGKIGAKSEEGSWAEFHFEIPQPLKTDTEND